MSEGTQKERDRAHFDRIAERYARKDLHPAARRARRHRLLQTVRAAGLGPGGRLLEVGCGAGFAAEYLRGHYRQYVGIDYSDELIAYARGTQRAPNASFEVADAAHFASAEPFDAVLMIGVVHHFDDIPKTLASVRDLVRPGGLVVANEPQPGNPVISLARALRKRIDAGYSADQRELDAEELRSEFVRAGLEDVRIVPQGLLSTPFAEVPLRPAALSAPLARAACAFDARVERALAAHLDRVAWNLVAVGRRPR